MLVNPDVLVLNRLKNPDNQKAITIPYLYQQSLRASAWERNTWFVTAI